MEDVLTPREAKKVDLSLNPSRRDEQVGQLMASMATAAKAELLINPNFAQLENANVRKIAVFTLFPLLGRRALIRAAKSVEILEEQGFGKGMEN